ncbi:MAG: DUF547 domain-containing protein [Planctomycetota bacterium]|nr:MAG: DUF547 domain-containing protein [Planctomycetota bacterium]
MQRFLLIAAAIVLTPAPARPQAVLPCCSTFDHGHTAFDRVLRRHVAGDRFDYAALRADPAGLRAYLSSLEAVRPSDFSSWSRAERYAFWINAYNAYTLMIVAQHYPVASIRDIGSAETTVWDDSFIPLGALHGDSRRLSLNQIEHEILRADFPDARVHAAVNCASIGCPPLRAEAYVAERLEEQLDSQARAWIADAARTRFEAQSETIRVSKIFEWFEDDFVRDAGGAIQWIERYAPQPQAAWIADARAVKLRYLEYDWDLNEVLPRDG